MHKLGALQFSLEDPEESLTAFRNAFHSSAVDTLGQNLANTKSVLMRMMKKLPLTQDSSSVSNTADYNNISMTMVDQGQSFADNNGMEMFHDALKSYDR